MKLNGYENTWFYSGQSNQQSIFNMIMKPAKTAENLITTVY